MSVTNVHHLIRKTNKLTKETEKLKQQQSTIAVISGGITNWAQLNGRPTSDPGAIDAAVTASHAAVTVSAPIVLTGQAIELKNDAAAQVTEIDTDTTLAGGNTKVPTDLAVKTYVDGKPFSDIVSDVTPQLGGPLDPNGFGITGEAISPNVPLEFFAGWARGDMDYVDLSDSNAYVTCTFYVAVGGSFKVRMTYQVDNNETVSGLLYLGDLVDGDAATAGGMTFDLANGVAMDLTTTGVNVHKKFESGAYTIASGATVCFKWLKDAAGTAGKYLFLQGVVLVRQ